MFCATSPDRIMENALLSHVTLRKIFESRTWGELQNLMVTGMGLPAGHLFHRNVMLSVYVTVMSLLQRHSMVYLGAARRTRPSTQMNFGPSRPGLYRMVPVEHTAPNLFETEDDVQAIEWKMSIAETALMSMEPHRVGGHEGNPIVIIPPSNRRSTIPLQVGVAKYIHVTPNPVLDRFSVPGALCAAVLSDLDLLVSLFHYAAIELGNAVPMRLVQLVALNPNGFLHNLHILGQAESPHKELCVSLVGLMVIALMKHHNAYLDPAIEPSVPMGIAFAHHYTQKLGVLLAMDNFYIAHDLIRWTTGMYSKLMQDEMIRELETFTSKRGHYRQLSSYPLLASWYLLNHADKLPPWCFKMTLGELNVHALAVNANQLIGVSDEERQRFDFWSTVFIYHTQHPDSGMEWNYFREEYVYSPSTSIDSIKRYCAYTYNISMYGIQGQL